jgi:hypothetical protein
MRGPHAYVFDYNRATGHPGVLGAATSGGDG